MADCENVGEKINVDGSEKKDEVVEGQKEVDGVKEENVKDGETKEAPKEEKMDNSVEDTVNKEADVPAEKQEESVGKENIESKETNDDIKEADNVPEDSENPPQKTPTSSKKKSSPKLKLPPIGGSNSLPLRYPPIGIGDQLYHPQPTPRRQLRPFGLKTGGTLSHGSQSLVDSNFDFQPDINSLSGRYSESVADSGFASNLLPYPTIPNQEYEDYDEGATIPMPFQAQKFKSSTVMRMVTVPRRHQEMFGNKERFYSKTKGMAFYTGRYSHLDSVMSSDRFKTGSPSQLSQHERLILETAHLEKLRDIRRQLDSSAPHRLNLNLAMGGSKVEFADRVDIPAELRELKNIILPDHARDLYVGRGIALPEGHQLNKPRRLGPLT